MLKKIHSVVCYVACFLLPVIATDVLATETGIASYYSDKFQGRKTASGEHYDRNKLTAAHRTLPIGSQIEVTNLKNQNSVIVTINDRGPYAGNRKLDLSYAAAKELGLVAMGVAPVSYAVVSPEKDRNFEKIIPLEYSPGVMGLAQSEEEVIEAEEELDSSDTDLDATSRAEAAQQPAKTHRSHRAKKTSVKTVETAMVSTSKNHKSAKSGKANLSAKSDKKLNVGKKLAKSDKAAQKSHSKSKKT